MRRLGRAVPLVAKLEKAEAIANLDEIIAEADAVMVARGDLGVELPAEGVPLLQKRIIRRANARGIPAITATQMLESMVHAERPTRAETSDVANAVLDGTDAVMLSAETAVGQYPVEAVATMAQIAAAVEGGVRPTFNAGQLAGYDGAAGSGRAGTRRPSRPSTASAISAATQSLTEDLAVVLVVAITTTGRTARLLSQRRLAAPVLACTEDEQVARDLALWWGVTPLLVPFQATTEAMITLLDRELVRRRLARIGEAVVVVGSVPLIARGRTNFVQVHRVGSREAAARPRPGRGKIPTRSDVSWRKR
jgi:pyruvate kinase